MSTEEKTVKPLANQLLGLKAKQLFAVMSID